MSEFDLPLLMLELEIIEKGRPAMPIGTRKQYNGVTYEKVSEGDWEKVSTGNRLTPNEQPKEPRNLKYIKQEQITPRKIDNLADPKPSKTSDKTEVVKPDQIPETDKELFSEAERIAREESLKMAEVSGKKRIQESQEIDQHSQQTHANFDNFQKQSGSNKMKIHQNTLSEQVRWIGNAGREGYSHVLKSNNLNPKYIANQIMVNQNEGENPYWTHQEYYDAFLTRKGMSPEGFKRVGQSQRELMAYQISQSLGFQVVPEVQLVLNGEAHTQKFLNGYKSLSQIEGEKSDNYKENLMKVTAFSFLIGNTDSHRANAMSNGQDIQCTDNGLSFCENSKYIAQYAHVADESHGKGIWNEAEGLQTSPELSNFIKNIDARKMMPILYSSKLNTKEIGGVFKRLKFMQDTIEKHGYLDTNHLRSYRENE